VSKLDVIQCGVTLEREKEWVKICEKMCEAPLVNRPPYSHAPPHGRPGVEAERDEVMKCGVTLEREKEWVIMCERR
jgi:hypothetical protein